MTDLASMIEEGKYFYRSRKFKKAEEIFKKVVEANHHFADVYNCLGLIAHEDGRFSEAIKAFKLALKANPRYTEALLNLSILYNDLGQQENAKKLVERSRCALSSRRMDIDPFIRSKLANKHAEVGDWYHGVGALAPAIEEYRKALGLEPKYADIRTKMAVCLREKGDKESAITEFKKALQDNHRFTDAHIQYGVTLYAIGKKTEARKVWREAAKRFPASKTIKMYLRFTGS